MRSEIYIPLLILGLSNIFSWIINYIDYKIADNLNDKIEEIIDKQKEISKKINTINDCVSNLNTESKKQKETISNINNNDNKNDNTQKKILKLENQVKNLQNSCNMFSENFESNMKTKNNIIPQWFSK